jgi:hypothetical protein
MFVTISHPKHIGVDRTKTLQLLAATLFMPFNQTKTAQLLSSFIVCSGVFAALLR